jgi:hypothetical protein
VLKKFNDPVSYAPGAAAVAISIQSLAESESATGFVPLESYPVLK